MKNALILHGTDFRKTLNQRNNNWFPWLKMHIEALGYNVYLPELPEAWHPDAERYYKFLIEKLSIDELKDIVFKVVENTSNIGNSIGEAMKVLSKELKGKADMKEVKRLVDECFKNSK